MSDGGYPPAGDVGDNHVPNGLPAAAYVKVRQDHQPPVAADADHEPELIRKQIIIDIATVPAPVHDLDAPLPHNLRDLPDRLPDLLVLALMTPARVRK